MPTNTTAYSVILDGGFFLVLCSQCKEATTQAIQLLTKDSGLQIFCLNCALHEQLSRVPAKEKTVSKSPNYSIPDKSFPGLSDQEVQELRTLNKELEHLADTILESANHSEILGIPTFLEICSICHKTLKIGDTYHIPQISTSATGLVEIKICQECMEREAVQSLLLTLQNVIQQSRQTPPEAIEETRKLGMELLETSQEIERVFSIDTESKETLRNLQTKYTAISTEWNLAVLEKVKAWPSRYDILLEKAINDEELRNQLVRAIQTADRISHIAEKKLRASILEIEPLATQEEVPLLAVQIAEILWARKKRTQMIKALPL
ncbi:MAG: hypothetical protein ACXAEI_17295 [Candidatus Hodarchaeales archaeon]